MHALLDIGTHTLLALDPYPPVVVFLTDAIPNSYQHFGVNRPAYEQSSFLSSLDPADYPAWAWDAVAKKFTSAPNASQEIRTRSQLAVAKARVANKLITDISFIRADIGTGILFQEFTYLRKAREAELLKALDFTPANLTDFPHTVQYADYAGITLKEAAERILFQAKLDDQLLAQSDILRIRYFTRLKEAATPDEVSAVADDFHRDTQEMGGI